MFCREERRFIPSGSIPYLPCHHNRPVNSVNAITIRPVRESDAEETLRLLNPIIEAGSYTIMTDPIDPEGQREYLKHFRDHGICYVATEEEGRVVGMQSMHPCPPVTPALAHVGDIGTYVRLDSLGMGIGSRLMEATLAEARSRGYRKIMAMIRADNPGALAFYGRHGFRTIGIAREHARIGDRYVDEVMTELLLEEV